MGNMRYSGPKTLWILAGLCALAVLTACAAMFAQDQPKPAATNPAQPKDEVRIQYQVSRSPLGDNTGPMVLKGHVTFTHNDTVLLSELVTYDRKAKTATSPGKISITDPECDITGDKGNADFNKKLGVIEGNVTMLIKPKPEPGTTPPDKDSIKAKLTKPTTVTCPKIEYRYKDKIATLKGPVSFKQEKRSGSAKTAVWDGKQELLTLTGDVKGIDEDGQTFAAAVVKLSLKKGKGDEWMEATNGSVSIKVDLGEETSPQKK